jgi:diaminopimelate epimerase
MASFTKMQGLGNDFIVIRGPFSLTPKRIRQLCDRHFGIGADGLIVVSPVSQKMVKMQYWNTDGSSAEMCGNGLRCVVRFAITNNMVSPGDLVVMTPAGNLSCFWDGQSKNIQVQVGKVINEHATHKIGGHLFHTMNVGNPHAVCFVDGVNEIQLEDVGPRIENHSAYPKKTNVEFAQVHGNSLKLKIWERGVGATLACGTGMVASAVLASQAFGLDLPIKVEVPGGSADVDIDSSGYATLSGPAENVFEGTF